MIYAAPCAVHKPLVNRKSMPVLLFAIIARNLVRVFDDRAARRRHHVEQKEEAREYKKKIPRPYDNRS